MTNRLYYHDSFLYDFDACVLESVERGGTDAGRIHVTGQGVPSISMGVPARYIHSHVSMIDRRDFDSTVKLLVALVKRLDKKTVASLT